MSVTGGNCTGGGVESSISATVVPRPSLPWLSSDCTPYAVLNWAGE